MHENDIIELNIEDFTGEGMGVAHLNGMTVFVQGGCPGDLVAAKITKVKKNFATAIVKDILNPSKHRVKPFCPMQNICGACSMQFIDYDYQLELKRKIVQNALLKVGSINFNVPIPVKSPEKFSYRHKIQYSVSRTKVSKRLLIGYYKPNSHEVVNIKHCPIQPEIYPMLLIMIFWIKLGFFTLISSWIISVIKLYFIFRYSFPVLFPAAVSASDLFVRCLYYTMVYRVLLRHLRCFCTDNPAFRHIHRFLKTGGNIVNFPLLSVLLRCIDE